MAMVKKSITLTDQQDSWIKAKIKSGLYGNEAKADLARIYWHGVDRFGELKASQYLDALPAIRLATQARA